jgi:GNAT superfamily N-acetyltransferase
MPDMLVKLYELDKYLIHTPPEVNDLIIRKPIGPEKHHLIRWVGSRFFGAWASEVDVAMGNQPMTCFFAVRNKKPVGFACYDATARGFFGPMGVIGSLRGKGVGRELLITTLLDMRNHGYGYAIIGRVGPADFYRKTVGAYEIPNSDGSVWDTWMR